MSYRRLLAIGFVGLCVTHLFSAASEGQEPAPIPIAVAKSFVAGQPQIFIQIAMDEFKQVMKDTSGLDGDVSAKLDSGEIARRLNDGQLDFGILFAHEYAWIHKKYPELKPFLIAANKRKDKRAHIVVHKDCLAKSIADLRSQKFDLPLGTKDYCRLYLDKICRDAGGSTPEDFFSSIAKPGTQMSALDQVARKQAQATVVDSIWLDFYKDVKGPFFANHLKILQESAIIPPTVIVYKPGALDATTVDRLRKGLLKAHTTSRGRALMVLWHIDSFEPAPENYLSSLPAVLRDYPPPEVPR